jgi:hypothetical protein
VNDSTPPFAARGAIGTKSTPCVAAIDATFRMPLRRQVRPRGSRAVEHEVQFVLDGEVPSPIGMSAMRPCRSADVVVQHVDAP